MMRHTKDLIWPAVNSVGLGPIARRLKEGLRARGLGAWAPLVPEREFYDCVSNAVVELGKTEPKEQLGDYLEFGVSRGSSMACVARALSVLGLEQMRLVGFDSFEGLPAEAAEEGWTPGLYHSTEAATRRHLVTRGVDLQRVTLVKGWFNDTLTSETRTNLNLTRASLIMIDCDIYSASKTALWFCEPLIQGQAVIFFDDWGWRSDLGEIGQQQAFEEFLSAFPDITAVPLPSYLPQARVFLVSR